MDNNAVGFIEYKGTKESLLSNTNIKDGDIVFGYDETSDISYIYHNGVFYGNTSELSEVLPEIYIGDAPPLEGSSAVVWYQTNVDIPDSPTKESCTIYTNIEQEDPRAKLSHEQALSNKDAFIKIKASVSSKTGLDITVITVSYDGTETSYKNCFITDTGYSNSGLISATIESAIVVQNINKPYISHIKISQFTNGWEYYEEGWDIPAAYASVNKKYLATSTDVNNHTTTYIGTENPSTISSKYNLWVDTSTEEVVFKYKEGNEWKVLSTGGSGSIEVDTDLSATSENPIANKTVYELATVIGEDFEAISKDLLKKASTENGLVEGRGFKVNDNLKYYLPNTTTTTDPTIDDTHIIATKADTLSNEVIDSKATVYNLYAMDELTAEQLAANETALVSVQNREVAIYKVYTDDDTYAIADVKLVPGPILEAYVYVNNPDTKSKQATVTKYTYSFDQAGEYLPSDKDVEEVIVPSIAKVNELISSGGTGGSGVGLELRELKMSGSADDNAYNLETLELMRENKVLPAIKAGDSTLTPITHNGDNHFSLLVVEMGIEVCMSFTMGEDGSITNTEEILAPLILLSPTHVLKWISKNNILAQFGSYEPACVPYKSQLCLADYYQASGDLNTRVIQFNYGSQRFERVYNATTGEEISTTEIPLGGGGGETGGGLETRILYVPELTAGSELTDEQKAYNAETCQKMLDGTAIAMITLSGGGQVFYANNIIDVASVIGEEGYIINFNGVVGFYIAEGDTLMTLPDVTKPVIIPNDVDSYDPTPLLVAIMTAPAGTIPVFYLTHSSGKNILCGEITLMENDLFLAANYRDTLIEIREIVYMYWESQAAGVITVETPLMLTLGVASDENNKKWVENKNLYPREIPTLSYEHKEYTPISINIQAEGSTSADFVIYREGAFETWRIKNDGSATQITK